MLHHVHVHVHVHVTCEHACEQPCKAKGSKVAKVVDALGIIIFQVHVFRGVKGDLVRCGNGSRNARETPRATRAKNAF